MSIYRTSLAYLLGARMLHGSSLAFQHNSMFHLFSLFILQANRFNISRNEVPYPRVYQAAFYGDLAFDCVVFVIIAFVSSWLVGIQLNYCNIYSLGPTAFISRSFVWLGISKGHDFIAVRHIFAEIQLYLLPLRSRDKAMWQVNSSSLTHFHNRSSKKQLILSPQNTD